MSKNPADDALVVKEPDEPARDPIISRSTSGILLISALLLTLVLAWALFDEVYGQRPWKSMQREFVTRYARYLKRLKRSGNATEKEVKESAEYQRLDQEARDAAAAAEPRKKEIDRQVAAIDDQLTAIQDPFQNSRGVITVINYQIETASSDSAKNKLRQEVAEEKQKQITVDMPNGNGSGKPERKKLTYTEIEDLYNRLKDEKARLLTERTELLKEATELAKKRDDYVKDNVIGLTGQQVDALIRKTQNFDYSMRQINVGEADIVDRCETCHLGIREPLTITPAAMKRPRKKLDPLARAFVSHPNKELLQIHNPDRFGCSSCHGGNGRATTTVVKAHGQNPFWLFPLHEKENMEAGCQQCHLKDRVLNGAPTLTLGKDLFQERGCVGCHRYEGFDRETDALSNARQTIKQLEEQTAANERQSKAAAVDAANAADDTEAQRLLSRAESLRVTNSQIAERIGQLNILSKYLMQDQKKVGPNLKDVRLKLRKEWIPIWLKDPQAFRPGTKMPTYWRFSVDERGNDDIKAIAAYLWQESFDGKVPPQQPGNAAHGEELFKTRGCMACHSVGEGENAVGGDFAANLQRVGQKASFDYIVRWIHNPRERWAPYCPKEKRDLTREDFEKKGVPFVFDTGHSKCPNDGAELQVQNMTVMPNFRLSDSDARDIATYLFSLSEQVSYPDASFMDNPNLKEAGKTLIKTYGCAGCHEIKGFEDEQRIGKELTTEGATPLERLDFAMLTHDAELGKDPHTGQKTKKWYNHKGFIENKLVDPGIYDKGKEKEPKDRLRMPKPFLRDEWKTALTTFLLGSVGTERSNVPPSLFYNATDRQRDIQEGWWVIKKYNCMGCHTVQVGQKSVLSRLPQYEGPDGRDQLPPALTTEGARVDPDWLLRFLLDPSLSGQGNGGGETATAHRGLTGVSGAQGSGRASANGNAGQNGEQRAGSNGSLKAQPGEDRNGVRLYLKARMPTFNFSPNELRTLVRFFMAVSAQQEPYIKEPIEPLTEQERTLARQLFTSPAAPCLKCHLTGNPEHDKSASAPNFLMAGERLKPGWTYRWLLDPQRIIPGTAMPSDLFRKDGERWVSKGDLPAGFSDYQGDHAQLLVRYMLQLTPDEQRRIASSSPPATGGRTDTGESKGTPAASTHHAISNKGRKRRRQISAHKPAKGVYIKSRSPDVVAMVRHRPSAFSP